MQTLVPPAAERVPARISPQLHEKDIMLTSAQRLAGLGSWVWDLPDDRLTWSEETFRVLGIGLGDFDGSLEGFLAHVHAADRQPLREAVEQTVAGDRAHFSYRYRLLDRDGRERLIQGDGERQLAEDGTLLRLVGTVVDVTERERERQVLHASEQRFRSLLALSSDWYWEQDAELRFTDFQPTAERHARVMGKRRWEIPDFTPLKTTWEEHQALLAARLPFRDFEARHGSGPTARYVSVSGEPFHDADGRFLGYRGTAREITERKAAEERLRQVNASLRMAMRLGRSGVWSLDLPQRSLNWWDGGRVVYAVDGAVTASLDQLVQRVEPAHRAALAGAVEACMVDGVGFELELSLAAAVHPMIWVRLIGEPHLDGEGRVCQVRGTVQDVTERRLAAQRVRELGTPPTATLGAASDAFLTVNREWQVSYLNEEAELMVRRPRQALVGRSFWDEFPELQGTRFEREYRQALRDGETVEFEEFFEPAQLWLRVRAHASPQGLAMYFRDITDSYRIRQALGDSEEELRNLFQNSLDGVLCTRAGDRLVRANPAACAMLGRTETELRDLRLAELVCPEDERLTALREQRAMTGRASGRLRLLRGDGGEFPAEVSSAEYTVADGSVRAFVVFRDISGRLRAEQEILQLNAELGERVRQRTTELEAANAELKALANSLAHDLQSPVAAIDGFAGLLEGVLPRPLPARATHYLGRIRAGARKTSEYAQGLLALARLSQAVLSPRHVDLSALAADLLTQLAERDPGRQVRWHVQEGMSGLGDPTLLRIALDNLLGNAWKFTRGRSPACIGFTRTTAADGHPVYQVRDNGAGFGMEHADRLFGNFQRLHTQEEFPGTGLGLANVQRIVGRHGGRVWAEGVEGEGACFYFTLGSGLASPRVK